VLYRSVYLSSMGYSLPVTTFKEKELSKIQGAPVQALLSGMGYNRNMPKKVVFGPTRYGGIGIRYLYIKQVSQQAQHFIRNMRHQGILGNNMWVTYQWFQVTTGTDYPVLEYPDTLKLPHAEGDWFIALQDFLSASNLAIYIPNVYTVQFRRTRDREY